MFAGGQCPRRTAGGLAPLESVTQESPHDVGTDEVGDHVVVAHVEIGRRVVNNENNIRANHSVADRMSRSPRTSPVSRAAETYGARNSLHSRRRVDAFLVNIKLTSSWSKYDSGSTTRRA